MVVATAQCGLNVYFEESEEVWNGYSVPVKNQFISISADIDVGQTLNKQPKFLISWLTIGTTKFH